MNTFNFESDSDSPSMRQELDLEDINSPSTSAGPSRLAVSAIPAKKKDTRKSYTAEFKLRVVRYAQAGKNLNF